MSARTLESMPAPVHELREYQLDHEMSCLDTATLLASICQGLDLHGEGLASVARWIDSVGSERTAPVAEDVVGTTSLPVEPCASLAAALELARRLEALPAPDVIRRPADVAAIARREVGDLQRERVIVIVCDAANRPLRTVVVSDGAVDRSLMPVREILSAVLRWDGRSFAIAHNHPCGDPEPSPADIDATRRIAKAAPIVGLRFLGHVVVGGRRWAAVAT